MRNVAFSERYQSTAKIYAEESAALFEGVDREANRRVLLKVMEGEPTPMRRLAFTREASLLGILEHPAFPKLLADNSDSARPFLVFEAIEGQPFLEWADADQPRPTTGMRFLRELASALSALHGTGHLHAEISPACIWVQGHGPRVAPVFLSTGRAAPVRPTTGPRIPDPTPAPNGFFAPELYRKGALPSVQTDLYGAGGLVYRYLTGRSPVELGEAPPTAAAIARIRSIQTDLGPLPRNFRPLLGRLLAKEPRERFGNARQLAHAVDSAPVDVETSHVSPGERVGEYRVQSVLGEGGFGITVLARDTTLQRDVALKFLHRGDAEDLLTEARAMARVTHPNVATVYGYGIHEGKAYLVMEFLPGDPLSRVLDVATEPLGVTELITILDATAVGVEAIHEAGMVHGDLKPANIVVGPAFRIGVTDFGLVQAIDHFAGDVRRIEGTPTYLAPERIRGRVDPALAHRIDVYALGILAYELITGAPPFDETDRSVVMQRHLHSPVTPPSALAGRLEALDSVVLRALHKDPRRRTPDVATFREELRDALAAHDDSADGLRILIVDPDRDERVALAAAVEKLVPAAHVAQAAIGSAALRRAARRRPDLILLELAMPDMNGVELLAQLRGVLDDPPPAVIVTASGSASDWPLLRGLGARAFMPKPVDDELFALMVERLLEKKSQ